MNIIDCPSMNFDSRDGHSVDMLVLHYTGMKTGENALRRLCDENSKVSAHYMVEENGDVYLLVPEQARAWHAGVSSWHGHTNINQRSIGIEVVNPGHEFGYRAFPEKQMQSVVTLCKEIIARHNIPARNVVAHSDVAPARKEDPGELFDWEMLAKEGVGLWPHQGAEVGGLRSGKTPDPRSLTSDLLLYGYDVSDLPKTITAFQRHFRPTQLTGKWDEECASLLAGLLASTTATSR